MIRTIKLHRELRDELGYEEFQLDVDNAQELVCGLKSQVPGFKEYSFKNPHMAVVPEGDSKIKKMNMKTSFGDSHTIHVMPTVEGAFDPITIGVALGFTGITAFVVGLVVNVVISMVVSSVAQSLASKPNTNAGNSPAEKTPSFMFNQPINVTSQGGAVPIAYGTCLLGSTVIAADLRTVDIAINAPATTSGPPVPSGKTAQNTGGIIGGSQWNSTNKGEGVKTVTVVNQGFYAAGTNPTAAFTNPTISGGVVAAGKPILQVANASVASTGLDYNLNDVLTIQYNGQVASFTVSNVSVSGEVIAVTPLNRGSFSATVSDGFGGRATTVSPAGGRGCTLIIGYRVASISLTRAGSGYATAPSVTFNGGGATGTTTLTVSNSRGFVGGIGGK